MDLKNISFEVKDNIGYIGFGVSSNKSLTVLTIDGLKEMNELIESIHNDDQYRRLEGVVFFSHVPGCFIAGMDINVIDTLSSESEAASGAEKGQELYNAIEDLRIPTVACVDGFCLGGGLELALACRHIIASDSDKTQLALPEVKLGLLPGFGGTYRLPLRVHLPNALDMILSGKNIRAKKALKMGLVDEIYPAERLVSMAPLFFQKPKFFKKKSNLKESLGNLAQDNFISRKIIFQKARESVLKKTKGHYQAPLKILDLMEQGQGKSRSSYLTLESQAFGELCVSIQSKNLRHIFFMHDDSKKYKGKKGQGEVRKIKRGAVIGAGTMGGGIAWLFADNGQNPYMKDINQDALQLGLKQSSSNFYKALKRKHITEDEFQRKQRSITPTMNYQGFNRVDLVIEAIVEDMSIKKKVFSELEKNVSPKCIISSNTSSLSISEMSTALEDPSRFIGVHFFNPVNRMPLVEIITHDKVAPEVIESVYNWVLKTKKTPIVVKDGPGFLVNRILMPYINEASYLLEEGVSIDDIDNASLNFGMPMGPCRLMDEVGLDVMVKVAKIMEDGLGERATSSDIGQKMVGKNCLGKKSGKGIYLYDKEGKVVGKNSEIESLLPKSGNDLDETQIQMRLFLPMINEAATILDEKIVSSAAEVDLALIFGIGFPPFRGGLLRYADREGLDRIYNAIKKFQDTVSTVRFKPARLLEELVEQKKKFYDITSQK